MSKNFTIMNVVSVYSEQELIKRFPKLSDPKVMKSFLSSSLIDESDDTKFIKTSSGMLDDNKYRIKTPGKNRAFSLIDRLIHDHLWWILVFD